MHVMMTKKQFEELKGKSAEGISFNEEDEQHGLIEMEDADVNYFYNASEGRLHFGPAKRKTLAAYCAGDNILGTFIMDKLMEAGGGSSSSESEKEEESEDYKKEESEEKKDQFPQQPMSTAPPSQ